MNKLAVVEPRTPEQVLAEHLTSWEAHVSAWIDRRCDVTKNQFVMGLIASSVDTHYGEKSLEKFAAEVGESRSTIFRYRAVYRRWYELSQRCDNLSWSHFLIVSESDLTQAQAEAIIEQASDESWSVKHLKRAVSISKEHEEQSRELPHIDPQMSAAKAHWKELKPRIERFVEASPQFHQYAQDFWEAVEEIFDDPWDSGRAFVERLIHGGCREVEALAKATRWSKATIERFCEELIAYGTHEWRAQGGKTDDARGARRKLIVPIEEPSGEMYGTRYGMVIGDDDDD